MSNYKYLVLSDLDGTLLNSEGVLSKATVDFVHKLNKRDDILFSFSTGRSWQEAKHIYEELQLKGFVSCNNGAFIHNPHTGYINFSFISDKVWRSILNNKDFLTDVLKIVVFSDKGEFSFDFKDIDGAAKKIELMDANVFVVKFSFSTCNEILNSKLSFLKSFDLIPGITVFWQPETVSVEISADFASKEFAVRYIGNFYGVSYDNILTFGDQINDLSVADGISRSMAVKNAVDIMKQKAKKISKYTNDEDSVIREVEKFLNSKTV